MSSLSQSNVKVNPPAQNGRNLPRNGEQKAHPPPKRGVLRTSPSVSQAPAGENGLFLDYLRGTLPPLTFQKVADWETGEVVVFAEPNQVEIESIFGPMVPLGFSVAKGYDQSAQLACGGTVHWHTTQPEQRVMINLGGDALANLGVHPLTLLEKLSRLNFQVTRMDWAKDDTEGLLNLGVIKSKLLRGEVVTRFRKWGCNESGVIGEDETGGQTIYIGNRQSESFLRCYDKAAQVAEQTDQDPDEIEERIRLELEIKKRKAQELLSQILETRANGGDVASLVLGVIYGLVDFKEPNPADSNKRRWETCSWWLKFLGVGEKVRVTVPKPDITLAKAQEWVNTIAPTLAIVNEIDPDSFDEALTSGESRWTKQHRAKRDRWKLELDRQRQPIQDINQALAGQQCPHT